MGEMSLDGWDEKSGKESRRMIRTRLTEWNMKLFQMQSDAYRNERLVIFKEEEEGCWEMLTTDEERSSSTRWLNRDQITEIARLSIM